MPKRKSDTQLQQAASGQRKTPPRNLLALPHLAINAILDHLNLRALKTLRLVCKQTKGWVEQPEYIQEFRLCTNSTNRLKQLIHSTVPWNNFSFCFHLTDDKLLIAFVERFGLFVKHLEIKDVFSTEIILKAIGPSIQTLAFEYFILMRSVSPQSSTTWTRQFANLKELKIDQIVGVGGCEDILDDEKKSLVFDFDLVLNSCSRLKYLKLPTIDHKRKTDEADFRKFILDPLLKYLSRFEESKCSPGLIIDLIGVHIWKMPITLEGLLELAQICSRIGARLCNVPVHVLPSDTDITKANRIIFDKSITSIRALDVGLENIYIPPTSQVHVFIHCYDPEKHNFLQFRAPIHTLHLCNNHHFPIEEPLLQELFSLCRPTVQEFKFVGHKWDPPDDNSFAQRISGSFPNLKNLQLELWGCDSDYILLLSQLPLLTHLSLTGCVNLTDEGLLGPDPEYPIILQLTNLAFLEMSRTNITDLSFVAAFRHMKLKTFKWTFQSSAQVTLDGISSLTTIKGGFKDSVEILEISVPSNCSTSTKSFYDLVKHFKNIRSFRLCKT